MTIRVDDDLGPDTPDDPDANRNDHIEFFIDIDEESASFDENEPVPEVVSATENLVMDDGDFDLEDEVRSNGSEPDIDENHDETELAENEAQSDFEAEADPDADADADFEAEADADFDAEERIEGEEEVDDEVEAEADFDAEADLEDEDEDEAELAADDEIDSELEITEDETDLEEEVEIEVEPQTLPDDEVRTIGAVTEEMDVIDLRPEYEKELEFETVFLSEADGAQADGAQAEPGEATSTNGHGTAANGVADHAVESPAGEPAAVASDVGHTELVEESTTEVLPAAKSAGSTWSLARATSVAAPAMAAVLILGAVGYVFGRSGGGEEVVRREFVYTLDESVPDSFLREDRRLLTQIVTIESDSVLAPVAEEFDLSIDDLRDKIEVETVDLSEVLRLEVADESRATALAISEAVINQYLLVSSNPLPVERSSALRTQRDGVVTELAEADAALLTLTQNRRADAELTTQEESLQRQIDLTTEHLNRLAGLIEDSLVSTLTAGRRAALETEQATADLELVELETQLAAVRTQRAELAEQSAEESALEREVSRLEADLATIDAELARRELGPLVASPVRALSDPSVMTVTAHRAGLQGLAGGVLLGIPVAALVAYRIRKRQLWLD